MKEDLPTTQAAQLVSRANRILIVGPRHLNGDSVGSLLGAALAMKALGKDVTLLGTDGLPVEIRFLPRTELFVRKLDGARDFVIELDISKTEVDTLSYNVEGNRLIVNVASAKGNLTPRELTTRQGPHKYDLILIADASTVDRIDSIYVSEKELFLSAPVLNIDHKKHNEMYGTVNLVDPSASSTSEVVALFLKELDTPFDPDISTALLAGIISATHALKGVRTRPSTLKLAAELIEAGASKEEIIENLYKAKPISAIKLWGRVLARLEQGRDSSYVYSSISYDDFKDCNATPKQARGLMDELTSHSRAKLFVLFLEFERNQISVRLRSPLSERAGEIASQFGGEQSAYNSRFLLKNTTLANAIDRVTGAIEGKQERGKPQKAEGKEEVNIFADDEDSDFDDDFYPNIPPPSYLAPKEGILTWRPDDEE